MSGNDGFVWRSNPEHHEAQARLGHLSAYYMWTLDLFGDRFDGPAADAGAGSGHFSTLLLEKVRPLVLLEGGRENLSVLQQRFGDEPEVTVEDCDLTRCESVLREHGVRSIFTLDVLEHIQDDHAVLRQFHDALPPGGKLYVKVPALPWLYGPVDKASGHFRRYTRSSLSKALAGAGFEVERCRYMNIAGVAPYFLKSRVLKREENFSKTFSMRQIERIRKIMPFLRVVDKISGAPVGLSVVCVARRN